MNTQRSDELDIHDDVTPVYTPLNEEDSIVDDEDDDDIDYTPASESLDEEGENQDTDTDLSGIDIEFDIPGGFPEDEEVTTEDSQAEEQEERDEDAGPTQIRISREQLIQLLNNHSGLRRTWLQQLLGANLAEADEEDDNSDTSVEGSTSRWGMRRRRQRQPRAPLEPVPNENGTKLMESGIFGTNERPEDGLIRKKQIAMRLLRRELGLGTPDRESESDRLLRQEFVPSTRADMIINYDACCYSGQFSKDGNFFFSCAKDFKVRMYDTSNPYEWKYYKTVNVHGGNWTITDATLSPDNRFLAASSIQNVVTLASTDPMSSTDDYQDLQHLDFARMSPGASAGRRGQARHWRGHGHFGIWSLRFSGDGREIVAGTGDDSVYVYDLERQQSTLRIPGHQQDVNAVCYGDDMSPHILFSGSDDCTLKVWDRRSMGDGRAAGVFVGHVEGLTYVDAKGDGRYVLSNGKDQTMKLWDLRKVVTTEEADSMSHSNRSFDYRSSSYPMDEWQPHPNDCSLVTFRGHSVLQTLIRCHFSPAGSSDSRYVYSGSQDGKVYVWNLDGTVKRKIDVYKSTYKTRASDPSSTRHSYWNSDRWKTVVRDASWHPDVGMIAATSWNGYGCAWGTCTVHSWHESDGDMSDEESTNEQSQTQQVPAKMVGPTLRDWEQESSAQRAAQRARGTGRNIAQDSDYDTD